MSTALGTGGSGSFTVVPSELTTHANSLSSLSGQLGQTVTQAEKAVLGSQAFGVIAVALAFANIIKAVSSPGTSALSQATSVLSTISNTIKITNTNYTNAEQGNTNRFLPSTTGLSSTSTNPLGSLTSGTSSTTTTKSGNNGASILTDVSSLEKDISGGNWLQGAMAGMKVLSDVNQIMTNPIGAVTAFGFNFLIQHVKPLQEAVGWLVGSPGQVNSYASQWLSISKSVGTISTQLSKTLSQDTANWTGAAADSYKATATDKINTISSLSTATQAIGNATQMVGQFVQQMENTIKKMVSDAMTQIIQTAMAASFMISIPVVVARVVQEVVSWMQKIANIIKQVTSVFNTLQPLMGLLQQLLGTAQKSLSTGVQPLATIPTATVPGITMPTQTARTAPLIA